MTSHAAPNTEIKTVVCFDFYDGAESGILLWGQGGASAFEVIGESFDGFRRAYLLEDIQGSYIDEIQQLPDYATLAARTSFLVPGPSSEIEVLKASVAKAQRTGVKHLVISSPYFKHLTFRPISEQQLNLIHSADGPLARFDAALRQAG